MISRSLRKTRLQDGTTIDLGNRQVHQIDYPIVKSANGRDHPFYLLH